MGRHNSFTEDLLTRSAEFKWFEYFSWLAILSELVFLRDGVANPMPNSPSLFELGAGSNTNAATGGVLYMNS